jgi:large subunit ribosomal protein L33
LAGKKRRNDGVLAGFLDFWGRLTRLPANSERFPQMAKNVTIKVKLVSSADTGFYYVTRKNSRTMTDKLVKKKYDPVAKKHVEFREAKIK